MLQKPKLVYFDVFKVHVNLQIIYSKICLQKRHFIIQKTCIIMQEQTDAFSGNDTGIGGFDMVNGVNNSNKSGNLF